MTFRLSHSVQFSFFSVHGRAKPPPLLPFAPVSNRGLCDRQPGLLFGRSAICVPPPPPPPVPPLSLPLQSTHTPRIPSTCGSACGSLHCVALTAWLAPSAPGFFTSGGPLCFPPPPPNRSSHGRVCLLPPTLTATSFPPPRPSSYILVFIL